jgi:hypothetical protein
MHAMRLVFIHGPAASGKLTVARELAGLSGFSLFHNHLVVDAVGAVFPFGSAAFVDLRERFWLDVVGHAAAEGRSLIFTFAPEPSVAPDFPARVADIVNRAGGRITFAALTIDPAAQEARIAAPSRAAFGKIQSLALLRELKPQFDACEREMPPADLVIDTTTTPPATAAQQIWSFMRAA